MTRLLRARRDDRGAFLLIFLLCLTLLIVLVAFAVDLGQGRFARRSNQQIVDLASLAAGRHLAGQVVPDEATVAVNPFGACVAAIDSVQTNASDFRPKLELDQIEAVCSVFHDPYDAASEVPACTAASAPVTAGPVVRGRYELTVRYPVPDGEIVDERFAGSGVDDGTDQCERMRVGIERSDQTAFARVIGIDTIRSSAQAVVRGAPTTPATGVAALVLLEREGCAALVSSGQGRIIVRAPTEANPGVITADSAGSVPPCAKQTNNASGWVVYAGNALPASIGGGPRIIAESAPDGSPGVIATHAGSVGGRTGCCHPDGLSVEPTPALSVTSRMPADRRFNPVDPDPTRETIAGRHASGYAAAVTDGAAVLPGSLVTGCDPAADPGTSTAAAITVNCPAGLEVSGTLTFPEATSVKFIGTVDVANGATLRLPKATSITVARPSVGGEGQLKVAGTTSFDVARRIDVGGTPETCTQDNANCRSVVVTGTLRVNSGSPTTTACSSRPGYATLATFGGTMDVTGQVSLCETTVYIGTGSPTYTPRQRTSGGNCTDALPCPVTSTASTRDRFLLSGGGAAIEWSAPNQSDGPPDPTSPFEALALWVEGSGLSEIKGSGELHTTGVFFLPNATFDLGGQGSGDSSRNSQFFARRLEFTGQGTLSLLPDPRDAIPTPIPGNYSLIR